MNKKLYKLYANDIDTYFNKHVMVPDGHRGKMVKINMHNWKDKVLNSNKLLIKKNRQVGVSELIAAKIAYNLNFKPNYNMLYVVPNRAMATYQMQKVVRQFSSIPDNLRVGLAALKMKGYYATTIKSQVQFTQAFDGLGVACSYDAIYMEEVDFMKSFERTYQSLMPCLTRTGNPRLIITTTPSGKTSYFNDLWAKTHFNKLEISTKTGNFIKEIIRKHSLNDISKTQYSKIIRECAIS